ncbi:MAG: flagellar basal body-associated FliL family protein [Rubellimicrobium sp.]|nr:flagellar basal body-associated FliL family protein [Rubellimicrobium sp.]
MLRLVLPVVLLIAGLGAGIGAGLMLLPEPEDESDPPPVGECDPDTEPGGQLPVVGQPALNREMAGLRGLDADLNYVRLSNQFIVPVIRNETVVALVILSLSVAVPSGQADAVLVHEPRLRDLFLQVLFDHANTGGFDGAFTATTPMQALRGGLRAAARDALGDAIMDVLITDLVRQDV